MSDINEYLKSPRILTELMMTLPVIYNRIFRAVLDALHMTGHVCKDTCETENALVMPVIECECLTGNQDFYPVLDALPVSHLKCQDDCVTVTNEAFHDHVTNIGFVSEINNMYSVESKGLKYRGRDEYAVAAAAVMVHDRNIQELLSGMLQCTNIETLEYTYSTMDTVDFSEKPHYIIIETPEHRKFTKYMLSEKILIDDDTDAQINTGPTWVLTKRWTNFNVNTQIVFETNKIRFIVFSVSQILGMGGRQNTQQMKQNQICENSIHAFRSPQQQHAVQAHVLSDTELIGGTDMKLIEGKYNDLSDGRYEKTIYVKTWTGRTVSLETDLIRAVETVKRQLKDRNPEGPPASREQRESVDARHNAEGQLQILRRDYRNDSTATGRNETQKS